jgi:hypothetical protein
MQPVRSFLSEYLTLSFLPFLHEALHVLQFQLSVKPRTFNPHRPGSRASGLLEIAVSAMLRPASPIRPIYNSRAGALPIQPYRLIASNGRRWPSVNTAPLRVIQIGG